MSDESYEPNRIINAGEPNIFQNRYKKLFIGGIDTSVTESDIKEYFEMFGAVTGCTIHRNRDTGRSRGFGFISFEDPSSVDRVQESRPHAVKGCEVTLKRAVPRERFQELDGLLTVNRIFVGGLRQEVQESDLREYFGTFGRIRKIDVMVDRNTNAKRGFAFVEFEDYDPVDKVVLQGRHTLQGQDVTVKKAKSRLEMELLKQRTNVPKDLIHPLMQCRSFPFQDTRAYGDTFPTFPRASLDNFDCPFHYGSRRRRYY